jgi:phosphoribosylanthranilate isomerase
MRTLVKVCCIQSVDEAITQVRSYGLDLCSGVRTQGELDEDKLRAFFEAVRAIG